VNPRAIVAARGLRKHFGALSALDGIDLELAEGRTLAILGPNGAGKSTLLRVVAGLAHPTGGELVVLAGRNRRAARAQVGFVGHATLLYSELSARENLVFAGRLYGLADPHARADTLLREEALEPVADRRAGTFSRGMAQRLAIARALVHDPRLVLLDEPFTGLDGRAADRLASRLGRLRSEGRTLLLVTHDLARASALADEVVILLHGRVVHHASGDALSAAALEESYRAALEDTA